MAEINQPDLRASLIAKVRAAIINELTTHQGGMQHGQTGPECVDVNGSDIIDITAIAEAVVKELGLHRR
jgi:hypothetical protein